jgi:hypothetical protein
VVESQAAPWDQTAPKAWVWNKLRSLAIVRIVLGIVGVVLSALQFA